jgi:hypothetical protein
MGARAVLEITDALHGVRPVQFRMHWASPEYQLPALADFVSRTTVRGLPLSVDSYRGYIAENPDVLPEDDETGQWSKDKPLDLDFWYEVALGDTVTYQVFSRLNPRREFTVVYSGTSAGDLYRDARARSGFMARHYYRRSTGATLPEQTEMFLAWWDRVELNQTREALARD